MKWPLFYLLFITSTGAMAQSYFQQKVDTRIEVRLDDQRHYLHGFEEFTYTNQSPDTLHYIYLHLWPNAYLNDRTIFTEQQTVNRKSNFYYSKPHQRGFIDSLDASINGQKVSLYSNDKTPDIARVDLPEALPPGGSFTFATPFRVKIPDVFSRLGHSGQAYYISQWFPKPAVYDRQGWHAMPYTDQGEFFSEFGSYDVSITLPENYVVMATGNCLDESENAWLDSLARLPVTAPLKGLSKHRRDSLDRFPKSALTTKTLHFHEDNVHDFAWFADKRFIVRKDTVHIAEKADPVTIYTACLPSAKKAWQHAPQYLKATVRQLSAEVGAYPYQTIKAVQGNIPAGGGMEYPTVAIIDRKLEDNLLIQTIVHEAGHNWFYSVLGSNERDIPWMDEGINTFYEKKVTHRLTPPVTNRKRTTDNNDFLYYQAVANGSDQPVNLGALAYTDFNYAADVYMKTGLLMEWLEGYMGRDDFRKGMQQYFITWQFRHPAPKDLEEILQQHTNKPLDWFFRDALKTDKKIDFALRKVSNTSDSTSLVIRNRSSFAAPVRVNAYYKDTLTDSFWTTPFKGMESFKFPGNKATSWTIGNEIPDAKITNNRYSENGLFHGRAPGLGFGVGIRKEYRERALLLPALGFNAYNGFMGGLLIHNLSLPEKKFRFALAPLYGFRSQSLAGAGSLGYFIHPKGIFREIAFQADIKRFGYDKTEHNTPEILYASYLKVAPSISFIFKNPGLTSPVTRTLMVKGYAIQEDYFDFQKIDPDTIFKPYDATRQLYYGLVRYTHQNERLYNPFSYSAEAQMGKDFAKLSLEGNARIDYNAKGKSLYLRGFAGKFISFNNEPFATNRYWLNTTYNGENDYLYDETYFGRNERSGGEYRQVSIKEGGFKIPTSFYASPLGRTDDWLASLNIKSDLPLGKLPVRLFLDVATFSNAKKINPSGDAFLYEAGAEIYVLSDVLLLHLPFILSRDYKDYLKSIYGDKQFQNSITFTLQLQKINWLRLTQGLLKYAIKSDQLQ
jgi:hypothetical protein